GSSPAPCRTTNELVGARGFEPPTTGPPGHYAVKRTHIENWLNGPFCKALITHAAGWRSWLFLERIGAVWRAGGRCRAKWRSMSDDIDVHRAAVVLAIEADLVEFQGRNLQRSDPTAPSLWPAA